MPDGAEVVAVRDVYRSRAEAVGGKCRTKVRHDIGLVLDRKDMYAVVHQRMPLLLPPEPHGEN